MGPALPASHGPRTWDVGQAPCAGRPDTRWSGRAPPREQRGRSPSRPADCVRTEEKTIDTLNPMLNLNTAFWKGVLLQSLARTRVVLSITLDGSLWEDQLAPGPRTLAGSATRASLEQWADHAGSPAWAASSAARPRRSLLPAVTRHCARHAAWRRRTHGQSRRGRRGP